MTPLPYSCGERPVAQQKMARGGKTDTDDGGTWSGENSDSRSFQINSTPAGTAVPELASLALLGVGVLGEAGAAW